MNNIKRITSTVQKRNKSLKSKIEKNLPKVVNTILLGGTVFYYYPGYVGPSH